MEDALKHLTKSTSELPYTVGARLHVSLVYAGLGTQGPGSQLLSVCPPDLLGVDLIGAENNTNTRGSKADRLFNHRATY